MDPLEQARRLLPFWVVWSNVLLWVPVAAIAGFAISWLARYLASGPLRKLGPDASWVERARVAYPVRRVTSTCVGLVPIMFAVAPFFTPMPLQPVGTGPLAALAAGVGFLAAMGVHVRSENAILRTKGRLGRAVRGVLASVLLHLWPVVLIGVDWRLVPSGVGLRGLIVLAVSVVVFLVGIRGGSLRVMLLLRLVKPASARLQSIVDRVVETTTTTPSVRAGTRADASRLQPRTFEVPIRQANAFALPLAGMLVVTEGAMGALTDDELAAITAHEVGHLTESWRSAFSRSLSGVLLLGWVGTSRFFAPRLDVLDAPALTTVATAIVALVPLFILHRLVVAPLARRLEVRADAIAHTHEESEGVYARALARLYEANLSPAVLGLKRAAHPDLYDRLVAANATPEYPRPAPPDPRQGALARLVTFVLLVAWCSRFNCARSPCCWCPRTSRCGSPRWKSRWTGTRGISATSRCRSRGRGTPIGRPRSMQPRGSWRRRRCTTRRTWSWSWRPSTDAPRSRS